MQPVGQFDDDHTHVRSNRQKELAQVFRLFLLFCDIGLFARNRQLGHAVHELGDLCAEQLYDVFKRHIPSVLHHVVQDGRDDARRIHTHVHDDVRHRNGVDDIGLAGFAPLVVVHVLGILQRFFKQRRLFNGIAGAEFFQNLSSVHIITSFRHRATEKSTETR